MANMTINLDALTAEQLKHLPASASLSRLGEIFAARHQPWCAYPIGGQAKLNQKPYTQADLADAIQGLEHYEVARALVVAAIHGDLEIAKAVWEVRGPFEVVHEHLQYHELINGTAVRQNTGSNNRFSNAQSLAEIKELLEWLPEVGLGFMVGVKSDYALLLESAYLEEAIKKLSHQTVYDGELPTLSGGEVSNPELLHALLDQSRTSRFPEAYSDILCWVPDHEVAQFGDMLKPFDVYSGLSLVRPRTPEEGSYYHRQTFQLHECTQELMGQVRSRGIEGGHSQSYPATWDFQSFDMRIEPRGGINEYPSEVVACYQANQALRHGFGHKPGHTLCHTSVDFLSKFNPGYLDSEKFKAANEFVVGYFPLDLLSIAWEGKENFDGGCLRRTGGYRRGQGIGTSNVSDLLSYFGDDSPIKDHVRRELPRPLVDFMINLQCDTTLDAKTLLAMKQGLGRDNTGFGVRMDSKGLQLLHDAGYQFSPETATHLPQRHSATGMQLTYARMSHKDTEVYLHLAGEYVSSAGSPMPETPELKDAYSNALRMNLWPAETPRPESLRRAIIQAAPKKKADDSNTGRALRAYFDLEGPENCIKAADTYSQVEFLRRHFGYDPVHKLLKLTTPKIRGRLLEDDLGM